MTENEQDWWADVLNNANAERDAATARAKRAEAECGRLVESRNLLLEGARLLDAQRVETEEATRVETEELLNELRGARDAAEAERDQWLDSYDAMRAKADELRNVVTVAIELIDRLADGSTCDADYDRHRRTHGHHMPPCPHPLGRLIVNAWRAAKADDEDGVDLALAQARAIQAATS